VLYSKVMQISMRQALTGWPHDHSHYHHGHEQ